MGRGDMILVSLHMAIIMPVDGQLFGDIIDWVEIGQMLETSRGRFHQHLVHLLGLATLHGPRSTAFGPPPYSTA